MFPIMNQPNQMGWQGMNNMPYEYGNNYGYYNQQYPIDYSQPCSNNCNCGVICVPFWPCGCQCPPPCRKFNVLMSVPRREINLILYFSYNPTPHNPAPNNSSPGYSAPNNSTTNYTCVNITTIIFEF